MKLNNLSRLTALLLALTMILPAFAVAEDGSTNVSDLTGNKLAQYNAAAAMIADDKCSLCAETLTNRDILTWPVDNFDCLHTYLASMSANEICQLLYDLDKGTSAEYTLGQVYINAHNSHVDSTDESLHRAAVICYGLSCYKNPLTNPGPDHVDGCPWKQDMPYTPTTSTTVTDQNGTGITVTGDIPEGVELTVKTAAKPSIETLITMIDPSKYAEEPNVLAYDITLTQADGTAWQPTTAVTVKVPGAYSTVPEKPLAEAVHMLADGGHEVLAATVNADGSVTFDATGFSDYYVVAGIAQTHQYDKDVAEIPSEDSTYYVEPGTVIHFSSTLTGSSSDYIHLNGNVVSVSETAPLDQEHSVTFTGTYNPGWGQRSYTVQLTFKLATREYIITESIKNYPVYLSIKTSAGLPAEPGVSKNEDWRRLNSSYITDNGWNWSGYTFSNSATGIIKPTIINAAISDPNGTATVGVYDATGELCLDYLEEGSIDWAKMKEVALDQNACASDGTRPGNNGVSPDDYIVVPYVIKMMGDKGYGWHIDCMLVPAKGITLSYDPNLSNFTTTNALILPNAQSAIGELTFTTGNIQNLDSNGQISATLIGDTSGTVYMLTFDGWNTKPDGSGIPYEVGKSDTIDTSLILYAQWKYEAQVGALRITKTATGLSQESTNHNFAFVITFTPEGGAARTWHFDLHNGEEYFLQNLLPGSYVITETSSLVENMEATVYANGELLPSVDGSYSFTANVTALEETKVDFVNAYQTTVADLTITKQVEGDDAPTGDVFTFTVTLLDANDQILSGSFNVTGAVTGTIRNGGTLKLTANQSVTIADLPIGTKYTVTETAKAGYTANESIQEGRIVAAGATATFTNTYSVADLTITKNVVTEEGVTAPADDEFAITVTLTAAEGAVLASSYDVKNKENASIGIISNGTGTFKLKKDQTATIEGIQTGTQYSVSEADYPYYQENISPENGIINTNNNAVTVTNTYQTGNLTVAKRVVGTFAPTDADSFTFTLMLKDGDTIVTPPITVNNKEIEWQDSKYPFTLKNGENITIYGIPGGVTYTVVETENPDYTTTVNGEKTNTTNGTIVADSTSEIEFTNTYKYSHLTITKKVSTDTPVGIAGQSFNITVILPPKTGDYTYTNTNGTSGKVPSDGKLTIKADEKITIDKVPIGAAYSVTEDDLAYFDEKVEPNSGTIVDADNAVNITNTYKPGKLTISKNVVGTTAPKGQESEEFAFVVTLTDEKGAKVSGTFAYTKGADTASLPFTEGSAEIKLKDSESITFTNLPQGVKYKVEEKADDVSAKYTPTSNGAEGTISGTDSNAAFTNTYQYSDLKISKTVVNASELYKGDVLTAVPFTFTVTLGNGTSPSGLKYQIGNAAAQDFNGTITLKSGETATIKNIPVGTTYTIVETPVAGYTTKVSLNDGTADDATSANGKIVVNTVDTVAFTNTYSVGQLTVTKTVVDNSKMYDLSDDPFTFIVEFKRNDVAYTDSITYQIGAQDAVTVSPTDGKIQFTLKDKESVVFHRLPADVEYEVTEGAMPYAGYTVSKNPVNGTIFANTKSDETFTNTYNTGSLTIYKTGMTGNETAVFTVTGSVRGEPISIKVVVPNGENTTVNGLELGGKYTVSELDTWTWRYNSLAPKTVEIPDSGNGKVEFENTKIHDYWLDGSDYEDNAFGNTGN